MTFTSVLTPIPTCRLSDTLFDFEHRLITFLEIIESIDCESGQLVYGYYGGTGFTVSALTSALWHTDR